MSGAVETAGAVAPGEHVISSAEERRVIIASSVGTVFEWYDFYLYAILAPFFAGLFFPPGNQTARCSPPSRPTRPDSWSGPSERSSSAASATW
jgi:hypothetical protein